MAECGQRIAALKDSLGQLDARRKAGKNRTSLKRALLAAIAKRNGRW